MEPCGFHLVTCTLVLPWVLLLATGISPEPTHQCIATLTVPRNTVWRAAPMQLLKINCTVTTDPHCWKNTSVSWCKVDNGNDCKLLNHSSHTITEWRNITGDKRISFLIFRNLSASHSGIYRCKVDAYVSTVSHNINVTVTDSVTTKDNMDTKVERNLTKPNGSESDNVNWSFLLPYVYICGGILLVVATVMLGSLLIIKCQRPKTSRKERTAENQYTATQVAYIPNPINNAISHQQGNTHSLPAHLSPSSMYDIPPTRASSHRDRPSAGSRLANQVAPGRRREQDDVKEEEEDSPLVYASLNHKAIVRRPIKVSLSELDTSEYAAIKTS
ncbi:B- and T-lymphocyte attenuator [Brachyhypopomus gauderio]|uniref:B- and T-lymphocyte attenuator n=1 Tax=Brachyhypopomus gauderio TaxID=698409 RepID=UPI0040434349